MGNATYSSKRDRWLEVLAWLDVVGMIVAPLSWRSREPLILRTALLAVSAGLVALLLSVLYGTHYMLTGDALLVRSGPFHWRIGLDVIETIAPTRNPLSSPAPSLDRLEIRCRVPPRRILISPRDKGRVSRRHRGSIAGIGRRGPSRHLPKGELSSRPIRATS